MNIPLSTSTTVLPAGSAHPKFAQFLAMGDHSAEAFRGFFVADGVPLVEPGALTFLWFGDAQRVEILRWIYAGVDRHAFSRVPGTDIWHLRLPVEDRGRFEYKLGVLRHGYEEWILDPLNPNRAGDPFGENSVARTLGYAQPEWSLDRGAPRGRMETLSVDSAVFGHRRSESIYLPHGYDRDRPYPLVIVHDGSDYNDFAALTVSLDNLIEAGDIPPLVAVLIQTHDRMGEYPRGRRHARYVARELLPAIQAGYAVSTDFRDRVLLGASLGAVAALSTAYRYPGTFGGLVLKSGSFVLDRAKLRSRPHPVFEHTARLVDVLKRARGLDGVRAFVSTGELEGLASDNRALAGLLRDRGIEVLFQSSWDGHHWHNWRDQLRDALVWVLGGRDRD